MSLRSPLIWNIFSISLWFLWHWHFWSVYFKIYPPLFFKRFYLFIFRERGREGEREGGKHQCVVASCTPPTGDLAHNPGMCPDWESNWQPFGSQAQAQSTELHQPRLYTPFFNGRFFIRVCVMGRLGQSQGRFVRVVSFTGPASWGMMSICPSLLTWVLITWSRSNLVSPLCGYWFFLTISPWRL